MASGGQPPQGALRVADRELAYWTKRQMADPAACPWVTDSVLPIVAANRVDIVKSAYAFNELVTLIPTPGHTIDHYSVQVGEPGADAIITGDMIHSPLQARYPELGMMSDCNFQAGRRVEARIVRPLLRYTYPHAYGAFPLAVQRPRGPLSGCVRLRRRLISSSLHGFAVGARNEVVSSHCVSQQNGEFWRQNREFCRPELKSLPDEVFDTRSGARTDSADYSAAATGIQFLG